MNKKSVKFLIVIALILLILPPVLAISINYAFESLDWFYESFFGWIDFFLFYLIFASAIQLFLGKKWGDSKGFRGLVFGLSLTMALALTTWSHLNNFRLLNLGPIILGLMVFGFFVWLIKAIKAKGKSSVLPLLLAILAIIVCLAILDPYWLYFIPNIKEILMGIFIITLIALFIYLFTKLFKKGEKPEDEKPKREKTRKERPEKPSKTQKRIRCWIEKANSTYNINETINLWAKVSPYSPDQNYTWLSRYKTGNKIFGRTKTTILLEGKNLATLSIPANYFKFTGPSTKQTIRVHVTDTSSRPQAVAVAEVTFTIVRGTPVTRADKIDCIIENQKLSYTTKETIDIRSKVRTPITNISYKWILKYKKGLFGWRRIEQGNKDFKLEANRIIFNGKSTICKLYLYVINNSTKIPYAASNANPYKFTVTQEIPETKKPLKQIAIIKNSKNKLRVKTEIDTKIRLKEKSYYFTTYNENKDISKDHKYMINQTVNNTESSTMGPLNLGQQLPLTIEQEGEVELTIIHYLSRTPVSTIKMKIELEKTQPKIPTKEKYTGKVAIGGTLWLKGKNPKTPYKIKSGEKLKFKAKIK